MPNSSEENVLTPFDPAYVSDLLKFVEKDVQSNTLVGDKNYLLMAADSCQEFNDDFRKQYGDKTFDMGE